MPKKVKLYVGSVIALGAILALGAAAGWSCRAPRVLLGYLAMTLLASFVKLRLPRMPGTYSLNFLFVLAGVCTLSLAETILIGAAGALAQSLWQAKKRPTLVQIAFNMANLTLTTGVCFAVAHGLFARGFETYRPAVLALTAAVYFVVNTVLVSGVLSLLEGKPLPAVCGQWYLWSFPYHLIGAAFVGVLPLGGHASPLSSWALLLPLAYLLHFFYGLQASGKHPPVSAGPEGARQLGSAAGAYITVVIAATACLIAAAVTAWQPQQIDRFAAYLVIAILASGCKISLPGMTCTVSLGFVPVLVNIIELPFAEAILISGLVPLVQCFYKTKHRPQFIQAGFSASALVVSTAFAFFVARLAPDLWTGVSLPMVLAIATVALYGCNTVLVATVIGLAERRPLSSLWQRCYFYSFPYYLVGAAAASLMILTARQSGWAPSILVLPLMGLVYVSYRMHLAQAMAPVPQAIHSPLPQLQ